MALLFQIHDLYLFNCVRTRTHTHIPLSLYNVNFMYMISGLGALPWRDFCSQHSVCSLGLGLKAQEIYPFCVSMSIGIILVFFGFEDKSCHVANLQLSYFSLLSVGLQVCATMQSYTSICFSTSIILVLLYILSGYHFIILYSPFYLSLCTSIKICRAGSG